MHVQRLHTARLSSPSVVDNCLLGLKLPRPATACSRRFEGVACSKARPVAAACPQHAAEGEAVLSSSCTVRHRALCGMSVRKRRTASFVPFAGQDPKQVSPDQVRHDRVCCRSLLCESKGNFPQLFFTAGGHSHLRSDDHGSNSQGHLFSFGCPFCSKLDFQLTVQSVCDLSPYHSYLGPEDNFGSCNCDAAGRVQYEPSRNGFTTVCCPCRLFARPGNSLRHQSQ